MDACCPVAAAVVSPRLAAVSVLAAAAVAAPRLSTPTVFVSAVAVPPSPTGAPSDRSTGPARAPPLA